ncbi:MAG: chemotaxis protein CheW [Anaerolineae bacterium]|nr:chemotaxis protein CheW [Anaerolineae bacterium]
MENPIDWDEIWKSLIRVDHDHDEAIVRERLRKRAQQYAAPKAQAQQVIEQGLALLTFRLGSETYGVDVVTVRGVREVTHITRVPSVPAFYRGVVNVRGQVVTVLDLRLFFNVNVAEESVSPTELVVVEANNLTIGLLAHDVQDVVTVSQEQVEAMESMPYTLGVTPDHLVVLSIEMLLKDDRLWVGSKDKTDQ